VTQLVPVARLVRNHDVGSTSTVVRCGVTATLRVASGAVLEGLPKYAALASAMGDGAEYAVGVDKLRELAGWLALKGAGGMEFDAKFNHKVIRHLPVPEYRVVHDRDFALRCRSCGDDVIYRMVGSNDYGDDLCTECGTPDSFNYRLETAEEALARGVVPEEAPVDYDTEGDIP